MQLSTLKHFLQLTACSCVLTSAFLWTAADAQRRGSDDQPQALRGRELKSIDKEAQKVETEFLKNAYELSAKYEKAGDLERAIEYLEAMLKINPDLEGAEEKIEELQEEILEANDFAFRFEVQQSWGQPVAFVREGKPFRVSANGTYSLAISETMGPNGFPEQNIQRDLIDNIAPGKLVGLIMPRPGARNNDDEDNEPKPFEIGSEKEITPQKTGFLLLKINTPATARVKGVLDIEMSGYVLAPDGKNIGR